MLPKERHPPPVLLPEIRADASMDRPEEFPNDCHLPMALRELCAAAGEAPKRPKSRDAADELKLPPPKVELRAKLPDGREENPPDLAYEPLLTPPLFLRPPSTRADETRLLPREPP